MAHPDEAWLDVRVGGRYALGLTSSVAQMIAVEPSKGMRQVFEAVRVEYGIKNVELLPERWPFENAPEVDVVSVCCLSARRIFFRRALARCA